MIEALPGFLQWHHDDTPKEKLAKLERRLQLARLPLQEASLSWPLLALPLLSTTPPSASVPSGRSSGPRKC